MEHQARHGLPQEVSSGYPQPMVPVDRPPEDVLAAYFAAPVRAEPVEMGHINRTFRVESAGQPFILQRLAAIFAPEINDDIAAIVPHLRRAGLTTYELLPSKSGARWHVDQQGGTWRLLTCLAGSTYAVAKQPATAHAAGAYLAQFHLALADVRHQFAAARRDVHDLPGHLAGLAAARAQHTGHVAAAQVAPLADEVLELLARLPAGELGKRRLVHGDAKISNFLFASPTQVNALVDLDTLGEMALCLELGDALRSWTNPVGDGSSQPTFLLPHFVAACQGYARHGAHLLAPACGADVATATLRIALELTARFLRDVLEESYFAWDRQAFAAAWQHQLKRARWQLAFARSLASQLGQAQQAAMATLV